MGRLRRKDELIFLVGRFFNYPVFIYPFADGQRFLCIYDDDTAVLVFVVDLTSSPPDAAKLLDWLGDPFTRQYMADRATNVVMNLYGGVARLPLLSELREVSSNLITVPASQSGANSSKYWPKESLLKALATNRQAAWP